MPRLAKYTPKKKCLEPPSTASAAGPAALGAGCGGTTALSTVGSGPQTASNLLHAGKLELTSGVVNPDGDV